MRAFVLGAVLLAATPASGLTPDEVANGFIDGAVLCAKAVARGVPVAELPASDRALVSPADAAMRAFRRAPEGRPVYDVLSAKGIVTVSEPAPGECDVSGYGPPVRPTFERAAAALAAPDVGFVEVESGETASDIFRRLENTDGAAGKTIVNLIGGEPGMQGRLFRFPLLSAYVRVEPPTP